MTHILDSARTVLYTGRMDLALLGRWVAQRRREKGLTLIETAQSASVGRSTLAALEAGQLPELGFAKVGRICAAVDLVLEVRAPVLEAPLMPHRHLSEAAGRDLTKAAIADVVERGDLEAWRGLVRAIRAGDDRLIRRVREVVRALDPDDAKVRAFAILLPEILRAPRSRATDRG
jgi:transcriptional regulator with XRE-family HTH domain